MFVGVELTGRMREGLKKVFGNFFKSDQAASHQSAEGGFRDAKLADIGDAHPAADGCDLGEEVGLVRIEFGESSLRHKDSNAFKAASVTFFGDRLRGGATSF